MEPHVGMKLWVFDQNRRVYAKDANGKSFGGPIWREHWVPTEIIGETSRSWLIGPEWMKTQLTRADKLAKKSFPGHYALSEADIDKAAFVRDRSKLADAIHRCADYDTLKTIEAALAAQTR